MGDYGLVDDYRVLRLFRMDVQRTDITLVAATEKYSSKRAACFVPPPDGDCAASFGNIQPVVAKTVRKQIMILKKTTRLPFSK